MPGQGYQCGEAISFFSPAIVRWGWELRVRHLVLMPHHSLEIMNGLMYKALRVLTFKLFFGEVSTLALIGNINQSSMGLIQLAYRNASMELSVSSVTAVVVPRSAKAATTSIGDPFRTCPTGQLPFACKAACLIGSSKKAFYEYNFKIINAKNHV